MICEQRPGAGFLEPLSVAFVLTKGENENGDLQGCSGTNSTVVDGGGSGVCWEDGSYLDNTALETYQPQRAAGRPEQTSHTRPGPVTRWPTTRLGFQKQKENTCFLHSSPYPLNFHAHARSPGAPPVQTPPVTQDSLPSRCVNI